MRAIILILVCFTFALNLQAQKSDFSAIDFDKADNIAKSLKGEALSNLPLLAHKLTNKLETDVERFRAIYFWVCNNIENDYLLMRKNERKRRRFKDDSLQLAEWNTTFSKIMFQRLLEDKKTLCTGYAFLVQELSRLAGIECEMIDGYGKVGNTALEKLDMPNHTWNAVKLNNKWYLSDPTWSAGYIDGDTYYFTFNFYDEYFLMAPEKFAIEHRPLDMKWTLLPATQTTTSSAAVSQQ